MTEYQNYKNKILDIQYIFNSGNIDIIDLQYILILIYEFFFTLTCFILKFVQNSFIKILLWEVFPARKNENQR